MSLRYTCFPLSDRIYTENFLDATNCCAKARYTHYALNTLRYTQRIPQNINSFSFRLVSPFMSVISVFNENHTYLCHAKNRPITFWTSPSTWLPTCHRFGGFHSFRLIEEMHYFHNCVIFFHYVPVFIIPDSIMDLLEPFLTNNPFPLVANRFCCLFYVHSPRICSL